MKGEHKTIAEPVQDNTAPHAQGGAPWLEKLSDPPDYRRLDKIAGSAWQKFSIMDKFLQPFSICLAGSLIVPISRRFSYVTDFHQEISIDCPVVSAF